MKVLYIEDKDEKYMDVASALKRQGIPSIDWEMNAEDGLRELQKAIDDGEPYELLVLDMQFPVKGVYNENAGEYVIEQLRKKGIEIPIIACSSLPFVEVDGAIGCVFYNARTDLDAEFRKLLARL